MLRQQDHGKWHVWTCWTNIKPIAKHTASVAHYRRSVIGELPYALLLYIIASTMEECLMDTRSRITIAAGLFTISAAAAFIIALLGKPAELTPSQAIVMYDSRGEHLFSLFDGLPQPNTAQRAYFLRAKESWKWNAAFGGRQCGRCSTNQTLITRAVGMIRESAGRIFNVGVVYAFSCSWARTQSPCPSQGCDARYCVAGSQLETCQDQTKTCPDGAGCWGSVGATCT